MENTSLIVLSKQLSVRRNLDLIANNIANANTTGFKSQHLMFEEYLQKMGGSNNSYEMVSDYGQFMNTAQGAFETTGTPLDLAIEGEGYFSVKTAAAEARYTRAGEFQLNAAGEIVTSQGYPVLDTRDNTIQIPAGTNEIKITKTGEVMADGAQVGQIGVWEFDNIQEVAQIGNNLYAAKNAQPQAAENSFIQQGMVEKSNVQPIIEMTRMLKISQDHQRSSQIVKDEHERMRTAIRSLGDTQS